jgi:hypothetical protein
MKFRGKNLFYTKQQLKVKANIKATTIDDFAYVFVRNLLHVKCHMLTA